MAKRAYTVSAEEPIREKALAKPVVDKDSEAMEIGKFLADEHPKLHTLQRDAFKRLHQGKILSRSEWRTLVQKLLTDRAS
jgi:hypothetical protein